MKAIEENQRRKNTTFKPPGLPDFENGADKGVHPVVEPSRMVYEKESRWPRMPCKLSSPGYNETRSYPNGIS
ncbi:MAG: hypothetical protein IPJ27_24450 [Candidatus Accumulibacter sp.]|uniref:Uncharacterized protein n=1 Tax=Candidatus Accumulibacter proximus TaxID=2954385 RepID=A0A935Q3M9_9PROT|nr:hypothetical protein [Candidatus Accumulibacter proximus]